MTLRRSQQLLYFGRPYSLLLSRQNLSSCAWIAFRIYDVSIQWSWFDGIHLGLYDTWTDRLKACPCKLQLEAGIVKNFPLEVVRDIVTDISCPWTFLIHLRPKSWPGLCFNSCPQLWVRRWNVSLSLWSSDLCSYSGVVVDSSFERCWRQWIVSRVTNKGKGPFLYSLFHLGAHLVFLPGASPNDL